MSLNLDNSPTHYQIRGYQPGTLQVNQQFFNHSIIISADQLLEHWPPQTINELTIEHFAPILALKPSILLLGTGTRQVFPPLTLYGHLLNQHIGVEIMDTLAACRTYNALTAENRSVVAALIIK